MKRPDDATRVAHIVDAATEAIAAAEGKSRANLDTDRILSHALVRLVEIIGEAVKGVSDETRLKYPEVPWQQIAGTRDKLIHAYFDVDLDILWTIVEQDLPVLLKALSTERS